MNPSLSLIIRLTFSNPSQVSYRPKQILIKEWKKKFLCTRHQSPQESRIRVVSCSDSAGSSVRRRLSPGWQFHSFADWNFCRLPSGGGLLIGRVSPVGGSQQPFMVALMGGGPGEERGTWPITSYQPHLQHSRHKRNRKSALNGTEEKPWSTMEQWRVRSCLLAESRNTLSFDSD